jgi:hypothetical protein
MEWVPIAAAAFTSGLVTGLLAYHARERTATPVGRVRQCIDVIWCSHCGMTQSALCQAHKQPVSAP